jgi:hypothetical protein
MRKGGLGESLSAPPDAADTSIALYLCKCSERQECGSPSLPQQKDVGHDGQLCFHGHPQAGPKAGDATWTNKQCTTR